MLEVGMIMLCFSELRCVQESITTLSGPWLNHEKRITLVLGSQSLLTLGRTCTLSHSAFNLDGLNSSHHLQGLGQSELREQGRGAVHPWPCDGTGVHAMHQLSVTFLGFLFSISVPDWVKMAWMTYKHTYQYIKKGETLCRTWLQCKRHVHPQVHYNI